MRYPDRRKTMEPTYAQQIRDAANSSSGEALACLAEKLADVIERLEQRVADVEYRLAKTEEV